MPCSISENNTCCGIDCCNMSARERHLLGGGKAPAKPNISLGAALVDIKVAITPTEHTALERHRSNLLNLETADLLLDVLGPNGLQLVSAFELTIIRSKRGDTQFELDVVGKMQQVLHVAALHPDGKGFLKLVEGLRRDGIDGAHLAAALVETEHAERTATQSVVLRAFYEGLGGDRWHHNEHWLSEAPGVVMGDWFGVDVDERNNVVALRLDSNNLVGALPECIGELKHLRELHIGCNNLGAPLPARLGGLSSLTVLHAHRSSLTGPIPESVGELGMLEELWLQANELTGHIPDEIGSCHRLQRLELWSNKLNGAIPDALGRCVALAELKLWSNQLTGAIPDSIGLLQALNELNLRSNRLSGVIPDSIGKCKQLIQLYLQSNQLAGSVPDSLANCAFLYKVAVWGNELQNLEETRLLLQSTLGQQIHFSF